MAGWGAEERDFRWKEKSKDRSKETLVKAGKLLGPWFSCITRCVGRMMETSLGRQVCWGLEVSGDVCISPWKQQRVFKLGNCTEYFARV